MLAGGAVQLRHILVLHILDARVGAEAVLREADAAVLHVGADLLVLGAIESVLFEQIVKRCVAGSIGLAAWHERIEKGLHHAAEFGFGAAGSAELVQLGASAGGKLREIGAEKLRQDERVIAGRHECVVAR